MSTLATAMRSAPEGLGLASLAESSLEQRFYSWLGRSGNRYVCTVFRVGEEEAIASFTDAAIIGVAHKGGARRPVCVLSPYDLDQRRAQAKAAVSLGANEWHVHFLSDRRELAADLGCL